MTYDAASAGTCVSGWRFLRVFRGIVGRWMGKHLKITAIFDVSEHRGLGLFQ